MNIREVLDTLNIPYAEAGQSHHITSDWIGMDCAQCSPRSGKFKLGIPLNGARVATCWTCGRVPIVEALSEASGVPYSRVRELVGWIAASKVPERSGGILTLPEGICDLLPPHRRYLERRGFDPDELARLWGMRGIGMGHRYAWRIFIPVVKDGQTVSYTLRSIDSKDEYRYKNARHEDEQVPKSEVLFGEDYARSAVVVTEGPFDAMRVGPGAVATMGLALSREQVTRMSRYPLRAICFDNEDGAQRRARKLCEQLAVLPGETFRVRLTGKDPASSPACEIRQLRRRFLD